MFYKRTLLLIILFCLTINALEYTSSKTHGAGTLKVEFGPDSYKEVISLLTEPVCIDGETRSCTTYDNCPGLQVCENKQWSACYDVPDDGCPAVVPFVCADGETRDCTTTQNCPGRQTCNNNIWSFCIDNSGDNCPIEPNKPVEKKGLDYGSIVIIVILLFVFIFIIIAVKYSFSTY